MSRFTSGLRKTVKVVALLLIAGIAVLAFAISRSPSCEAYVPPAANTPTMKAVISRCYGGPEALEYVDVPKPVPTEDEVLVRVHAAAINPLDWHYMRGEPYVMRLESGIGRPKMQGMGVDFAGVVEAVGSKVTKFKPGDEVFGAAGGSLAEFVTVREVRNIVRKPSNVSFAEAAAVPIAAVTALQALRDKARVKAGDRVLVNGASGGVGTYAVQIGKALGAEVTGVASTRNVELVRSIGAAAVVDYTQQDFTHGSVKYDVIVDNVGSHSLRAYTRVMPDNGVVVLIGSTGKGAWLGPLGHSMLSLWQSLFVSQKAEMLMAQIEPQELSYLGDLLESGKVKSVIDRRYPLDQAIEAIDYLEKGRACGKVVVDVIAESPPVRLAALVPKPMVHLTRYHRVFAPHSR